MPEHRYPQGQAIEVAVRTVQGVAGASGSIEQVTFACFSPEVLEAYRNTGIR